MPLVGEHCVQESLDCPLRLDMMTTMPACNSLDVVVSGLRWLKLELYFDVLLRTGANRAAQFSEYVEEIEYQVFINDVASDYEPAGYGFVQCRNERKETSHVGAGDHRSGTYFLTDGDTLSTSICPTWRREELAKILDDPCPLRSPYQ